jgi:hypothetical protein
VVDTRFRYFSKENEGLGKARITVLKELKEFTFYH